MRWSFSTMSSHSKSFFSPPAAWKRYECQLHADAPVDIAGKKTVSADCLFRSSLSLRVLTEHFVDFHALVMPPVFREVDLMTHPIRYVTGSTPGPGFFLLKRSREKKVLICGKMPAEARIIICHQSQSLSTPTVTSKSECHHPPPPPRENTTQQRRHYGTLPTSDRGFRWRTKPWRGGGKQKGLSSRRSIHATMRSSSTFLCTKSFSYESRSPSTDGYSGVQSNSDMAFSQLVKKWPGRMGKAFFLPKSNIAGSKCLIFTS